MTDFENVRLAIENFLSLQEADRLAAEAAHVADQAAGHARINLGKTIQEAAGTKGVVFGGKRYQVNNQDVFYITDFDDIIILEG